ncbi:sugar phosphate isomerase/epimerase family protein [Microbulbifer epialgicus]|uniref:Sugar phosphate isomerase/epimerase family protein n=1 Tax=Microbulbifer epialgicus TaxID=393907 RepID=A0ABV4NXL1_9GAMM
MLLKNFFYIWLSVLLLSPCPLLAESFEDTDNNYLPNIGVQLWSVKGELKKDFTGTLKAVKNAGFNAVEFAGELGPYRNKPTELRKLLDAIGLKVSGAHIPIHHLQSESIENTVSFYKTLGAEYLIVGWDPRSWDPQQIDELILQLRTAHQGVTERSLKFGFHNHDGEFQPFRESTFWDLIATSTDQEFILQLDIGWVVAAGKNPVSYLERYPGRAYSTHFKARIPKEAATGKPIIGEDTTDWMSVLKATATTGGTKWIILEQEEYPDGMSSIEALKASKKGLDGYIQAYLSKP